MLSGLFIVTNVALVFYLTRRKRFYLCVLISALACFYLASTVPVASLLLAPLEGHQVRGPADPKNGRIVILAGGIRGNQSPAASDKMTEPSLFRLMVGIELYKKSGEEATMIITGRRRVVEEMACVAERLGVDKEDIVLEGNSRNTYEHARELLPMLHQNRFYLVTSAGHMPRAMATFKKLGMHPVPWPGHYLSEKSFELRHFLPAGSELAKSDNAVYEYLAIVWYMLRGHINISDL